VRLAFFTRLTWHEAMPATGKVPRRLQPSRAARSPPLLAASLSTWAAPGWLTASRAQACPAAPKAAASGPLATRAARCQPGSAIKLDSMPVH
jgi:hypothetical protein